MHHFSDFHLVLGSANRYIIFNIAFMRNNRRSKLVACKHLLQLLLGFFRDFKDTFFEAHILKR